MISRGVPAASGCLKIFDKRARTAACLHASFFMTVFLLLEAKQDAGSGTLSFISVFTLFSSRSQQQNALAVRKSEESLVLDEAEKWLEGCVPLA